MELMKHPVVLEAKAKGLKSYQEGELSKKLDGILKGDKGTQRHTAQDFETIEGTKKIESQALPDLWLKLY